MAALIPAICNANPEDADMKACAKAFASCLAPGSAAPKFTIEYHRDSDSLLRWFYATHDYAFKLQPMIRRQP